MEILGLDWHAWMVVVLIFCMFATMLKSKIPADVVFLTVMALLTITGCLTAEDALSGFSSTTVIIVGALFIVVAGLDATGVLHWVVKHLLGQPKTYWMAILRLMIPVAVLSAFLSNTTVVALFIKVVKIWSEKLKIAPSKLLIPLSYAAGMGGVCTLIGTPPNLIISSFYTEATDQHLSIFATTIPGLFCLAVGVASIILMQKLLPSRKSPDEQLSAPASASFELKVRTNSNLPGQTLADIFLKEQMHNSRLVGLVHFDGEVEQITSDADYDKVFLMGGDTLIFTGDRKEVLAIGRNLNMDSDIMDREPEQQQGFRTFLSSMIMLGMVLLSAFDVLPLLTCCFIAALLMLITRCCSIQQAKRAINWDVIMVFACSVTLGKAIDSTGLAQILADNMASICGSNALLALFIFCFLGTFLTEFVSNTACGAILAPVAINIATTMGVNPLTFCIGLMISVSSSFATPIGSPTHLMVYVPGGYRFSDFLRIGLPMNFIILIANIFITLLLFPL